MSPLFFLHIPKTAGMSLNEGLLSALKPDRALYGRDVDHLLLDDPDGRRTAKPDVPAEIVATYDYLSGHIPLDAVLRHCPTFRIVTMMRDPVTRLMSHYRYFRALSAAMISDEKAAAMLRTARGTFEEFLLDPSIADQTDNIAARLLLSPFAGLHRNAFIEPTQVERLAKALRERIEMLNYVGFVEDEAAWSRLGSWLGVELIVPRINETPPMPESLPVVEAVCSAPASVALIEQRCCLDRIIWLAAKQRANPVRDIASG